MKWNEKRIKGTRGNGSYPMLFQRRAFRFGQNTKNKQKKKKIYDVYSGKAMVPSRVLSSSPLEMTTNTRDRSFLALDKKKKGKNTNAVLIITGRVSSVLSTFATILVPRVTSPPLPYPCHNWREGNSRNVAFPTAPSPPPSLPQTFLYFGFR